MISNLHKQKLMFENILKIIQNQMLQDDILLINCYENIKCIYIILYKYIEYVYICT